MIEMRMMKMMKSREKRDDSIIMKLFRVLCSLIPIMERRIRKRLRQPKDESNVKLINTNTHRPKLVVLCCWWPIIVSFRKWEVATPRPLLIIW